MPDLSSSSRKKLLEIAREAIKNHLEAGNPAAVENFPEELKQLKGCFVTLKKNHELRGCVGTFDSKTPLCQNVPRMAKAAAFQDTRFTPVSHSELEQIKIEISVLGELQKIDSIDEIQIGRDGVWIKSGNRGGTYLPEVAVEQKWSKEEFVMHCAREKAGLNPQDIAKADIYRYEVEKIKE